MRSEILLLFSVLISSACAYSYIQGPAPIGVRSPCPGRYCGRSPLNDTHVSECGSCHRGWRVGNNSYSLCEECDAAPSKNDWLFLSFHVVFVLVLHWTIIDLNAKRRSFTKEVLILHGSAVIEVIISAVLVLLLHKPYGELTLTSCEVQSLSDWYSLFHNPTPNYEETLQCTQEVVYPLYTIVFAFYAANVIVMLIFRPYLSSKFLPRRGRSAIYAALYFLPILGIVHSVFGGLIYMSYPYIIFVLSIVSSAAHFAFQLDQTAKALICGCFTDFKNFVVLIGHWCLHAFAILSITQWENPVLDLSLLILVPLPAVFYIATAVFTDPNSINADMNFVLFSPASPNSQNRRRIN